MLSDPACLANAPICEEEPRRCSRGAAVIGCAQVVPCAVRKEASFEHRQAGALGPVFCVTPTSGGLSCSFIDGRAEREHQLPLRRPAYQMRNLARRAGAITPLGRRRGLGRMTKVVCG